MQTEEIIIGSEPRLFITEPEPLVAASPQIAIVSADQWIEVDNRKYGSPIRDQKIYQTCSGCSTITAFDIAMRKLNLTLPILSFTYPYIKGGGGPRGALLSKVTQSFEDNGTCPEPYCPDYLVLPSLLPPKADDMATFKAVNTPTNRLFSVEEMGTALSKGAVLTASTAVGPGLNHHDQHGIIPVPDRAVGYHAWCILSLRKLPEGITSRLPWMFLAQSSWGKRWGSGGFGYLLAEHFDLFGRPVTSFAFWPGHQTGA